MYGECEFECASSLIFSKYVFHLNFAVLKKSSVLLDYLKMGLLRQ